MQMADLQYLALKYYRAYRFMKSESPFAVVNTGQLAMQEDQPFITNQPVFSVQPFSYALWATSENIAARRVFIDQVNKE